MSAAAAAVAAGFAPVPAPHPSWFRTLSLLRTDTHTQRDTSFPGQKPGVMLRGASHPEKHVPVQQSVHQDTHGLSLLLYVLVEG